MHSVVRKNNNDDGGDILPISWLPIIAQNFANETPREIKYNIRHTYTCSDRILLVREIGFLPRDAMHKRGLRHHAVSVSVYVCPSVTFVDYIKTSNRIVKIFTTE